MSGTMYLTNRASPHFPARFELGGSIIVQAYTTVTAQLVPNGKRLDFLPQLFPGLYIHGEVYVYENLESIADDYNGGYWNYYTLSNGGYYMAPEGDEALKVTIASNFFDGELSPDAA